MTPTNNVQATSDKWLPWLADSPIFVDRLYIASFFDAVARPSFRTVSVQQVEQRSKAIEDKLSLKATAGLSSWFPWLKAEVELAGEKAKTVEEADGQTLTLEPIETPTRQLIELVLHYVAEMPERIHYSDALTLPDDGEITDGVRMLTFLDIPAETMVLPMAAEVDNGLVVAIYDELLKRSKGEYAPAYPEGSESETDREEWWNALFAAGGARTAMDTIEYCIGSQGRPQWVDYRLRAEAGGLVHFHMVGHGEIDTGVFAYNIVKRGYSQGIRVVGTLRSGPAVSVMAVYDK